jgi:hypothetical protein
MDYDDNGYISYRNFVKILEKFKSKLNNSEILKIALRYEYINNDRNNDRKNENEKMKKNYHGNENENNDENLSYEEYINNFKNNEISGTVKGMSKRDPVFKTWISDTGLDKRIITDTPDIEYVPLVDRIVRILEILLKSNANGLNLNSGGEKGGVDMSNFSWVCIYLFMYLFL